MTADAPTERHTVRDPRARKLDDLAQHILALTQGAGDAEAHAHVQCALDSLRRFALRAGWIE